MAIDGLVLNENITYALQIGLEKASLQIDDIEDKIDAMNQRIDALLAKVDNSLEYTESEI